MWFESTPGSHSFASNRRLQRRIGGVGFYTPAGAVAAAGQGALNQIAGAGCTQRQRSARASLGALQGNLAQALRKRLAERDRNGYIEAAADNADAERFSGGSRNAHAGVAHDALARFVNDFRVRDVLGKAAAGAGEMVRIDVVLGRQKAHFAASRLAATAAQTAARLALSVVIRKALHDLVEGREAALDGAFSL